MDVVILVKVLLENQGRLHTISREDKPTLTQIEKEREKESKQERKREKEKYTHTIKELILK